MSDVIITMKHCRDLRYCIRGVQRVCDRLGLDWRRMMTPEGIRADEFPDDDDMINKLKEHAAAHQGETE